MNYPADRLVKEKAFNLFAIFLLIFSLFSSSLSMMTVQAQDTYEDTRDGHGSIKNEQGEIDYDEATINKEVSFGNKPGEFFIDLTVKGKSRAELESMDIAVAYDNSNSMKTNNRVGIAKAATDNFVNGLLTNENSQLSKGYQMALVTYGSAVFDGRHRSWLNYPGNTANWSHKTLTKNAGEITSKIPNTTPDQRSDGGSRSISQYHGGTFTQQAVQELEGILDGSNADHKVAVIITDGATTLSQGPRSVEGNGSTYESTHGERTLNQIQRLKDKGYTVYSVGIEMAEEDGISKADAEQLVRNMATSPDHAFLASNVQEVQGHLESIAAALDNTIRNGSITDPITDEFILPENPFGQASSNDLSDGEYYITANDPSLLEGVQVRAENQHIYVDGLNLGANDEVVVRYKVQIDTLKEGFDPTEHYKTNGTTTLTPDGDDPDKSHKFPEPEAAAEPIKVSGKKVWVDWGYDAYRPDAITLQLVYEYEGTDYVVDEVTIQDNGTDVWDFEFENAVAYDDKGNKIQYKLKEIMPDGSDQHYDLEYGEITEDTTDARNLLRQDPKIELVKTAKSTSELGEDHIEAGKDINYTFEFTNTGNLPLKDINLEDELDGISAISYDTLNGNPIDNIADVVMEPGDVIVASATYEVTQDDVDNGQVVNHAEVVGTPTVPDPDRFGTEIEFDDTPVKDDDDASVPGELEPEISLTKTADKAKVTEVGEEIEYTFEVENTGNTTLTEVTLNDPMLGGEITLDVDTLEPGESTTVTVPYQVTQEDINNGEIVNEADVEGTPPPAYTDNPDNPDKVTDEDDETVEADQSSDIELVKEADKDNLVEGETITYTFTATNTGNTTLSNVVIEDILDGISATEYLTVNGDSNFDKDNIVLEPGDVLVAEAEYVVTQDDVDAGQVFNEATVTGIDPKEEEVTDKDDESVPSEADLSIDLEKTSDKKYVTAEDQEIEYTFKVTNTSNVTLKDVKVIDEMLEEAGVDVELAKTTLLPGESTTGKATYQVTKEDIEAGIIENVATTTGTPPNPNDTPPVSPPAEHDVPVAKIDLEKSVSPDVYTKADQELTYTLVVTNTGEVTLNEVSLTDDMLGGNIDLDVDSLEPGEKTTVEVPYTVTEADVEAGEILNTATTEGTPEGYDPEDPNTPGKVTDEDEAEAKYAALALEKTSDKEKVEKAGEEITYTFKVTNVGKTVINDLVVNDDMLAELDIEVELEETSLEPGASTTGTAVYTVTQEDIDNGGVYNVATTTGNPPGDPEDPPVSPPDEEYVPSDRNPEIELVKSTETEEYTEVGQEIEYLFTVTNKGNTTLNDVKVEDETFKVDILLDETTLAPGESTTGTYTHTVTQENLDNGEIHNFANTEGTPPPVIDPEDPDNPIEQDKVTDKDDEKVPGKIEKGLALTKKADKQEVSQAGEEITYTLTVKNTGNVTLKDVTVNDEMLGGDLEVEPSTLAPGETGTVTGTYTVTQDDIDRVDEIKNIATATGTPPGDPEDPPVTPPVEEDVPVKNDPSITLVKQADKEKLVEGETITYTFTATNTGNTTLEKVNLVDELDGISDIDYLTVNGEDIVDPDNITLKPGDVLVATATYDVTQADVDANEVYNHATVEGTPPPKENPEDPENPIEQDKVTDDDDEKVPGDPKPDLSLEKIADKEKVSEAGEIITYKFIVTNTGNVTLDDVRVDDQMLKDAGVDEIELEETYLAPGESTVGYADYTVTQDDIDNHESIINIATATGTPPTDPEDPPVTPPVEEEVPVEKDPSINLIKTADKETYVEVGEEIEYTFAVTNTGNVTLSDVKVYDETFEIYVDIEDTVLAPKETTIGTHTHIVTQEDLDNGEIHNFATTEGTPPPVIDPEDPDNPIEQDPVTDKDDEIVDAEIIKDLALEKEADKQYVEEAGEEIEYTLTVTNTGNVTLEDVTVNDEMLGGDLVVNPSTLAPGEQGVVKGTYEVTQDDIDNHEKIVNIATATGTPPVDPEDPPVTPPVEEDVPVKNKAKIELVKEADKEEYVVVGEEIEYTFTVTNVGNTTLEDVKVHDETFNVDIELAETVLKPGESTFGTWTYTVTQDDLDNGQIDNIAVAEGTPPPKENPDDPDNPKEQEPVKDEDDETVKADIEKSLNLIKEAEEEYVSEAGETITYKFTVTNTGNVTLKDVRVDDPMLEEIGEVVELETTTLKPGETTVGYGVYTVTQDDIDNHEKIVNIATATGTPPVDPEDPPVTPPVEEEVPVEKDPAISLEKTSDTEKVTKEGQVVTYNFVVTNTGNVSLLDPEVNDPMLGGKIKLDVDKLVPGESTSISVKYVVTKEDLEEDELVNVATATGTPPNHDPNDPDSPQKPVDEDDEVIPVEKPTPPTPAGPEDPGKELPKTATDIYNWLVIGLVTFVAGLLSLFFTRRKAS